MLFLPHEERRRRLRRVLGKFPDAVATARWGIIDFSQYATRPGRAKEKLERSFSKAMARRSEGLVLKPTDSPYLPFSPGYEAAVAGNFVKVKVDYIPGLGDSIDFAVVGANFDGREAVTCGMLKPRWTSFHIACLVNKHEVVRFGARPCFKSVGSIHVGQQRISTANLEQLCRLGQFNQMPGSTPLTNSKFSLEPITSSPIPDDLLWEPFVVEILESGFEKPSGENHYMLRHPRITKIHWDRTWKDAVSFDELQDMARLAKSVPSDVRREERKCLQRLHAIGEPKRPKFVDTSSPFSQRTTEHTSSTKTSPEVRNPWKIFPPPMVRVDSCEMHPSDDKLVSSDPPSDTGRTRATRGDKRSCLSRVATARNLKLVSERRSDEQGSKKRKSTLATAEPPNKRTKAQPSNSNDDRIGTTSRHCTTNGIDRDALLAVGKRPLRDITNGTVKTPPLRSIRKVNISRYTSPHPNSRPPSSSVAESSTSNHIHTTARRLVENHRSLPLSTTKAMDPDSPFDPQSPTWGSPGDYEELSPSHSAQTYVPDHPALTHSSPFHGHTIYLVPCISSYLRITEHLLSLFRPAHWTRNLAHWDRDVMPDIDPMGPVVGESQAYAGLQKAAFVEPRRLTALSETIQRIKDLALAGGEVVEVWNWTILEELERLCTKRVEVVTQEDNQGPENLREPGKIYVSPMAVNETGYGQAEEKLKETFLGVVQRGKMDDEGVRGPNQYVEATSEMGARVVGKMARDWMEPEMFED